MTRKAERTGTYGNDEIGGEAGHDEMYGQLGDDMLSGGIGDDALVGDLGAITTNLLGNGVDDPDELDRRIRVSQPPIAATIFRRGTLHRQVTLFAFTDGDRAGGNDILLGGDGADSVHGGAGNDLINGDGDGDQATGDPLPATTDADQVFGGDGDDVVWGGRGEDHVWGGYGNDYLDVVPRPAMEPFATDPAPWFAYGGADNHQGADIVYGGWGQDALQANVADNGAIQGDRLLDWNGSYNVYYGCNGATQAPVVTRASSKQLITFLQQLAEGDGAFEPTNSKASGFREIGIVFDSNLRQNTRPAHPDAATHFTCQ